MPELPSRIDGEIIEAEHMNAATIRSVQRYTSAAQRDSLNPVPEEGQPAWLSDVDELTIWTGTAWIVAGIGVFLPTAGGTMTGILVIESQGVTYPGATVGGGTANEIGFRWESPDVIVVVDNNIYYAIANADDFVHLVGDTMTGILVMDSQGITYTGAGGSNTIAFKWGNGRVTARIDNAEDATLALLADTEGHVERSGDTMTGDLSLPTHTILSKDAQFGSGQEIQMLEDGSAVIGNGLRASAMLVRDANAADLNFHRESVGIQWRFRIGSGGEMLLESYDGSSWQTEDTWTRT